MQGQEKPHLAKNWQSFRTGRPCHRSSTSSANPRQYGDIVRISMTFLETEDSGGDYIDYDYPEESSRQTVQPVDECKKDGRIPCCYFGTPET